MKLFTCTDHDSIWPVGVASIVLAESEDNARELLTAELCERSLGNKPFTLQEVAIDKPQAIVLKDGNY